MVEERAILLLDKSNDLRLGRLANAPSWIKSLLRPLFWICNISSDDKLSNEVGDSAVIEFSLRDKYTVSAGSPVGTPAINFFEQSTIQPMGFWDSKQLQTPFPVGVVPS